MCSNSSVFGAKRCVKGSRGSARCAAESPSAEWIISRALMSPGLTSQVPGLCLLFLLQNRPRCAPEGARWGPLCAFSAGARPTLCFMHHAFNKHRQHPHFQSCRLKGQNFSPSSPLLCSPPNPRLYQLSIKKIQLQFGITQNTLITKGW